MSEEGFSHRFRKAESLWLRNLVSHVFQAIICATYLLLWGEIRHGDGLVEGESEQSVIATACADSDHPTTANDDQIEYPKQGVIPCSLSSSYSIPPFFQRNGAFLLPPFDGSPPPLPSRPDPDLNAPPLHPPRPERGPYLTRGWPPRFFRSRGNALHPGYVG